MSDRHESAATESAALTQRYAVAIFQPGLFDAADDAHLMFESHTFDGLQLLETLANVPGVCFIDALHADALVERAGQAAHVEALNIDRRRRLGFKTFDHAADRSDVGLGHHMQDVAQLRTRKQRADIAGRGLRVRATWI